MATYFTEQCYNLLRHGGYCGIVIPSGIYTDLSTKQLRELLFSEAQLTNLFGLSNEKYIFENVHHAFRICLMTFQRGGSSDRFNAAFRINPREAIDKERIGWFLHAKSEHLGVSIADIRSASPDSLSIPEVRDIRDFTISKKMSRYPRLGDKLEGTWNLVLTSEFNMTTDSGLFRTSPAVGRLPLYEGKMIHQFTHKWGEPKYFIDESEARLSLLGNKVADLGQLLDYQHYRLAFRDVAASTNERTVIATVLPPNRFCPHTMSLEKVSASGLTYEERLYLVAVMNSFLFDLSMRRSVTSHVSFFFVMNTPVPRLKPTHPAFAAFVERAARLICTTPAFDDLAHALALPGLRDHRDGATDPAHRARLRAEIDGIVAHLYGLTEDEFAYILTTFPLVAQPVKDAALAAYRDIAGGKIVRLGDDPATADLRERLAAGEGDRQEFKIAAKWNEKTGKIDGTMTENIVQAVAAFLNTDGGTLWLGVDNAGKLVGLTADFAAVNPQRPGQDTYELMLRNLIGDKIGKQFADLWRVRFVTLDGETLCRVDVDPAPEPAYLDGDLYIRDGGKKGKMKAAEAHAYLLRRFENRKRSETLAREPDAAIDYATDGLFSTQTKITME